VIALATAAVVASNQLTTTSDGSAPWDVLYVAVGSLVFVLVIVALGAALNKREQRAARSESGSTTED